MITIYKYPLEVPLTTIPMPDGAVLLHVHEQDGEPTLWALVDTAKPERLRQFLLVGTGWATDLTTFGGAPMPYIGTAHCDGLVWHIFDGGWVS